MTPALLQIALAEEIEKLFSNTVFADTEGKETKLKAYRQSLPIRESEDEPDPLPYAIVRIEDGKIESDEDPHEVSLTVIFGFVDTAKKDNKGHLLVLNAIQRLNERFEKNPVLDRKYRFKNPFHWAMQDEDSWPYFFGAASLNFDCPEVRKEDELA